MPVSSKLTENDLHVSRKFVYQQVGTARQALDDAFCRRAEAANDVMFYLPVTKDWLKQLTLAMVLHCHSPLRGVQAGPDHSTRCQLFDFVVAELEARQAHCPHRIGPVVRLLKNQRDELLAFAAKLDDQLAALGRDYQVAPAVVRELLQLAAMDLKTTALWQREDELHSRLGARFFALQDAVMSVADETVRASSVIENINSRLRNYFFLRRHLGPEYLDLLRFFLNHRRFPRSERPERVGKSPAELLVGSAHPHWLEMLGYQRFQRN